MHNICIFQAVEQSIKFIVRCPTFFRPIYPPKRLPLDGCEDGLRITAPQAAPRSCCDRLFGTYVWHSCDGRHSDVGRAVSVQLVLAERHEGERNGETAVRCSLSLLIVIVSLQVVAVVVNSVVVWEPCGRVGWSDKSGIKPTRAIERDGTCLHNDTDFAGV